MPGRPTITVLLDNGSGTFPNDITQWCHIKSEHLSFDHGRSDEFADVEATSFKLRLNNSDGRFTLGSSQYGCFVDQKLRVVLTKGATTRRYTGSVNAWPVQWDGPLGNRAYASITVVGVQARLERLPLRSMVESEAKVNAPTWYWPLNDGVGVVSVPSRGSQKVTASQTGLGAAPMFGVAPGPLWAEDTACTFSGGKYLYAQASGSTQLQLSMCAFVNTSTIDQPIIRMGMVYTGGSSNVRTDLSLSLGAGGSLVATFDRRNTTLLSASAGSGLNDGRMHHVGARFWQASSGSDARVDLWIDGVMVLNGATFTGRRFAPGTFSGAAIGSGVIGDISHVLISRSALDFVDLHAAGLTGFAGETSAARFARLGQYAGGVATTSVLATTVLDGQQLAGMTAWEAMKVIAQSEGGRLFVDQYDVVNLRGRKHGFNKATNPPSVSITTSQVVEDDTTVTADKQFLKNQATGTRTNGADQLVENETSIAMYGVLAEDLGTLLVRTDDEVTDRCSWIAAMYGVIRPRINQLTIDLLTKPDALQQALLATEIGDRIGVTALPAQAPAGVGDLIVEGWTEELGRDVWTRTYNTSAAVLQQPWKLGDPVFGALGSWPLGG